MDDDERQRKLEAGRAKKPSTMPRSQPLASFRQKRAKGDGAGAAKKTAKRKGQDVSKTDRPAQERPLEQPVPPPPPAGHAKKSGKTNQEEPQKPKAFAVHQHHGQENPSQRPSQSPTRSPVEEMEELVALTGKEQLKQLQQAVEKRNEIIAKLSSNLQEALASRDQVQLEAHSLAGQIQALQKQLQQTSVEFLRIKSQTGLTEVAHPQQQRSPPGRASQDSAPTCVQQVELKSLDANANGDTETDTLLFKQSAELELERANSHRMCAELAKEMENCQQGLRLLEEEKSEWEKEMKQKEAETEVQLRDLQEQLSQAKSQSFEIQQYKEEKELLNTELLEMTRKLKGEQATAERLKEELLEEGEKEIDKLEKEDSGLKASKNRRNHERATFGQAVDEEGEADQEDESEDGLSVSISADILMERYLSSAHPALSNSSLANQSLEEHIFVDNSANYSFELNSEVLGDPSHLFSISNPLGEHHDNLLNFSDLQCSVASDNVLVGSAHASSPGWPANSTFGSDGEAPQQRSVQPSDLAKELLGQQCEELREELDLKERELDVLREEVSKSAVDLEEARNRWAQEVLEEKAHLEQQEVNHAGGSIATVEQELFSKQLKDLQVRKDLVISELVDTKARHDSTASLLVEKTLELDSALKDLNSTLLQVEAAQKELVKMGGELKDCRRNLGSAEEQRSQLEDGLALLKCTLSTLEEAQVRAVEEREVHRLKEEEMDGQLKKMEQVLEEELEQFETLIQVKDEELAEVREKWEQERQEKEVDLRGVRHLLEEQRRDRESEVEALMEKQALALEETTECLRRSHHEEVEKLSKEQRAQVAELNSRLEGELSAQKAAFAEEHKGQISLIKQVTEREHQRMLSELSAKHEEVVSQLGLELTSKLGDNMETAHQAELQQTRTKQSLELEALRLSLDDLHTSRLELSQANLRREREAELCQVQAELRDKWTGENAILQAKQQFELDRLRQQNQQDLDELRQQYESSLSEEKKSMEMNRANEIQTIRSQWEEEKARSTGECQTLLSEIQRSLTDTESKLSTARAELSDTRVSLTEACSELSDTQASLGDLRASSATDVQRLEGELDLAWADRDAAAHAVEDLVTSHKTVLKEKELHACHLEEKEQQLQQEVGRLQEEQAALKKSSEQEVGQLWAQLESMRTSRQELGELREQLLARSSCVDDMERLKAEFNEQRREIKQQNESELESLRRYFEKRLRAAEEGYREEVVMLQLRLVEGALEESLLKTGDASFTTEGDAAEVKNDLAEFTLKLEKHKEDLDSLRLQLEEKHDVELSNLRSSLSLSYKEELGQACSALTDRYYEDLENMKRRHALDLQQLRARLSENHVRELTRVQLEAARQVEGEVEQRMWGHSEELQTSLTIIQTLENRLSALGTQHDLTLQRNTQQLKKDFAKELLLHLEEARQQRATDKLSLGNQDEVRRLQAGLSSLRAEQEEQRTRLEGELEEEREKLRVAAAALESDQNPQVVLVKRQLQAQYDGELQKAKSCRSAEVKELAALLQEQGEDCLRQAELRFQAEKGQLEQRLAQKVSVSLGELNNKHQAELEQQRTALLDKHAQELHGVTAVHKLQLEALGARHQERLAAMATELDNKHTAVLVAMEASLDSKWRAELEHLATVFQETNQVQLEALEADLAGKHKEERDELERRMLGNMDTLEATYLKEVQALRDDMACLEEGHTQEVERLKSTHSQEVEWLKSTRAQEVERLQSELVSSKEELRMELAQMHMEKFSAMATELSHAHTVDLSAQKEALDAEHCKALESLKMQVLELEEQHGTAHQELSHTYNTEKLQLCDQQQLQLQELRSASARELEACRRELEEESSRQRLHFLEEMEHLKVQSEERLQDRLGQLKAELEQCKEAELEEQRRSFSTEREQKEQSYTDKMNQLTAQLQQLDAVVAQLRAEVGCLQGELEGKRAEMETLDTLLQRRDRESQEGGNLLNMLGQDLQTAKEDRLQLHQANEKLRKVLLEVMRSTVATEELIGQKVNVGPRKSQQPTNHRSSTVNSEAQESGVSVGEMTGEESELTQLLCESLLVSETQLHPAGEEAALGACGRLRLTVDTLLELLNQANAQLEQAHSVHLSLEQRFSQGTEDSGHIIKQHGVLLEQLNQEAGLKSHLQVELHKAEGLLDGYVTEKALLEEALQQKESREERLAEELEGLRVQLHQKKGLTAELDNLRAQHQELNEEHAVLLRQREHLSAGLGEREKGCSLSAESDTEEAGRLTQERLDVQRQAEKDRSTLSLRLRALEAELEERETKGLETELHHKAHSEDLHLHVQALEKQLKHNRQFIDREHERDEFQQEINRLEAQLRQNTRGQATGDNRGQRVESLQALIKDKTEDYDSLIAANQQAQRDLTERNDEIDKLAGRIRELEQALLNSAESSRSIAQQEQELQRTKLRVQELTQDKQGLEQQQLSNKLQIAALQSKLDESRQYHDDTPDSTQPLRDALDTAQLSLQSREQAVEVLISQLEQVQANFSIKEAELKHLTLQLELMTNQNADHVHQLQDKIVTLEEKNLEIDQLNQEIQRLEAELECSERDVALGAELEELRSRLEHLRCDISRLRQDKQDEEERLHEVISTLQAELATLGPTLHEVSDSQDGDSVNPSPSPSPELRSHSHHGGVGGRQGAPDSLRQELRLTRSSSSRSLQPRLDEEEYRGHGEELGRRLREERERVEELRGLLAHKDSELEEVNAAPLEITSLRGKRDELSAVVVELRRSAETQKKKEDESEVGAETLREANLALEGRIQQTSARVAAMEKLVADGKAQVLTLETVKGELFAEREALRRREGRLQESIECLGQEVVAQRALIQQLQLRDKEDVPEDQTEMLTHAEVTLAKADLALRQKEAELASLSAEQQALRAELAAVKKGLSTSTERAAKLQEEGQTKDRALADLETYNHRLKAELRGLQEDLAVQEEELAYQQRELHHLRQHHQQQDLDPHSQDFPQKDLSHGGFEDHLSLSHDEASLSSPEVLRKLECSKDRSREPFHTSVLQGSHLSELSALNCTAGLDLPRGKASPRAGVMEQPRSRTITPESVTRSTRSPGSVSASDNFSMACSGLHLLPVSSRMGQRWIWQHSELGVRLRAELEQTERLDAQFVEYLRCRGMNPATNTDSAAGSMSYSDDLLSPELQHHLPDYKVPSVDQTPCQSHDHRTSPLDQPDGFPSVPPMGWQQEKRALQETVVALRELLCRMAQRDTQSDVGGGRQREEMTESDGRLEAQLRVELEETQSQLRVELEETQKRLRVESEETQSQLRASQTTQQEHRNAVQSLGLAVQEAEEALRTEQSRVQELQTSLEQERALTLRREREEEDRREVMQGSLEQQGSEVVALGGQLEQEKVACSNLRRELQIEQSRSGLLEKRLGDAHKDLQEEQQRSAQQQVLHLQDRSQLERLLVEAESRSDDAHRKLEVERERCARKLDEFGRRQEADVERDRKLISDMRAQLEQERRQAEMLVSVTDRLRAELLQEQKLEESRALAAERERCARQGEKLAGLKEQFLVAKDEERAREEQREKERRKDHQEQSERDRRQDRTNSKLCELELLRKQDQQRVQELQRTLSELEREKRQMAAQRLAGSGTAQPSHHTRSSTTANRSAQTDFTSHDPQPGLFSGPVETLLRENSELTERVASLSQERVVLKQTLAGLERRLRRAENNLAKVTAETENRPIAGDAASHGKVQRLYERYLRAESFRKSLVYQKRYLVLLLGGFQECEQATLCLIAHMGARPSPTVQSQRRPLTRFRAVVCAVIAVSRAYSTGSTAASVHSGTSQDPERSLTEYIHHLEKVQRRLVGSKPEEIKRLAQPACSRDMIGYRQRWLQENRTWLYLSCLSPLYLYGPGVRRYPGGGERERRRADLRATLDRPNATIRGRCVHVSNGAGQAEQREAKRRKIGLTNSGAGQSGAICDGGKDQGSLQPLASRSALGVGLGGASANADLSHIFFGPSRCFKPSLAVEEAIKQNDMEHYRRLLEMVVTEKYSKTVHLSRVITDQEVMSEPSTPCPERLDLFQSSNQNHPSDSVDLSTEVARRLNLVDRETTALTQQSDQTQTQTSLTWQGSEDLPRLTKDMSAEVSAALTQSDPNLVLSSAFKLRITQRDLATLREGSWLNDEVINFYLSLVMERSSNQVVPGLRVYCFSTFFLPKLRGGEAGQAGGHWAVKRWTKGVDLFLHDLILVPLHLNIHWAMAVIDLRSQTVKSYDSMGQRHDDICSLLLLFLREEHKVKKGRDLDTSRWTVGSLRTTVISRWEQYMSKVRPKQGKTVEAEA
ncbi:hypothetical protein NHX12_020077, partial [Muraenolepis orangiensis]